MTMKKGFNDSLFIYLINIIQCILKNLILYLTLCFTLPKVNNVRIIK